MLMLHDNFTISNNFLRKMFKLSLLFSNNSPRKDVELTAKSL